MSMGEAARRLRNGLCSSINFISCQAWRTFRGVLRAKQLIGQLAPAGLDIAYSTSCRSARCSTFEPRGRKMRHSASGALDIIVVTNLHATALLPR